MSAKAALAISSAPERAADRQSAPSKVDSLVLYGALSLVLFGPVAFGGGEPWSRFALEAGSTTLLLVWSVDQIRSGPFRIIGNPLFAPMFAFATLILLQLAVATTAYRGRTLSAALQYVAYGTICFLVVQCLHRSSQIRIVATVITIYGASMAVLAALQDLTATEKLYWIWKPEFGGWIFGPYVNHNHYAGLMEMLAPIPLVCSLRLHADRTRKALAIAAAALMACTIFLSGSRGGMAAFIVEIALLGAIVLQNRVHGGKIRVITLFFVAIIALLAWLGGDQVADRITSVRTEVRTELSGGTRFNIARDGIKMFAQRPIAGWGLAVFPDVYPRFRSFSTTFFVNRAHSDYIQLLVETGAAGFAVMIWWVVRVYRGAFSKIARWESDMNGSVALAAVTGCTGILVHSFVDSNLQIPANALLFYVLCVIAAMPPRLTRRMHRHEQAAFE